MSPAEGDEFKLRRADQHAGRKSVATVTLRTDRPLPANTSIAIGLSSGGHEWRLLRSETVDMCGRSATRVTGILRGADIDGVDRYHELLSSDYIAGGMLYPIRMAVEITATDRAAYQPDIDTFVDGLQIVPKPAAG
ncbi:hypothetical protein [Nocardia aurantia]|uniref:hypothetical protein n=1 Tax=Nocardia aurantia TaxID=2585199 RepID=UPI0012967569|nr:hypothetical protein [Nocardia aurantia]